MPLTLDESAPARTPGDIQAIYKQTCTVNRACELAQVSRRTIYNWMEKNKIRFVRTAGGPVRIYLDSLFKPGSDAAPSV